MMPSLRVIDTGIMSARWNVAATAALAELHCAGRIGDTLRFHRYPNSVLVGRHQIISRAINEAKCRADGLEIARRITGGGAVYMAPGALAWDLVADARRAGRAGSAASERVGGAIAAGLARLGLAARYRADNEVEINGRKICGMSGYSCGETVICQGTILIDTDLSEMSRYLRLPSRGSRNIEQGVRQRLATVREFLGRIPDRGELESAIGGAVTSVLGMNPVYRLMSAEERSAANSLHGAEYGDDLFVSGVSPTPDKHVFVGHDGAVDAFIRLAPGEEKRIEQIWLTGTFAMSPERTILDLEAALRGVPVSSAPQLAEEFLNERAVEISGASRHAIAGAILNAQ